MKYLTFFLILFLFGCSKTQDQPNQKPNLNLSFTTNGLELQLSGSSTDNDGVVTDISINWGDNKVNRFSNNDFSQLLFNHTYLNPSTYEIIVIATDDAGDSTSFILNAVVDFKETSLAGVKQTLFKKEAGEYLVLTINLHTYQESQQNEKFNLLTDVIGLMDIDFIAFQECAQHKTAPVFEGIIREDNMALEISRRLIKKYNIDYSYVWAWSHYGWEVWEEGVAVMSKFPLIDHDDRYVSTATGTNTISSRKVIYAAYQIPEGNMHIFSAHTHWRTSLNDVEQNRQIDKIKAMTDEKEVIGNPVFSIVCGDFNVNPTSDSPWSEGYFRMVRDDIFQDSFLAIYPDANNKPAQAIYNTIGGNLPGRIDYIFNKVNPHLIIMDSQIIFTPGIIGKVSDHSGVLTKIKILYK
jgi:maltose 6'-phosphate phosphatase